MRNSKTMLFYYLQIFFQNLFFNYPLEMFYTLDFSFKENIITILKFCNVSFYEINEDLIVILFFDNSQFLFPITCKGIWKIINLPLLYDFGNYIPFNLNIINWKVPIYIPTLPYIKQKLPTNYNETQIFFNSLRAITDFNYIGNISLNDIFYDEINKYYIILNFECLEYKSPYIEVRLDNLLNESGNIYYLNNQPLNTNDFYFFKNMGMI